MRHPEGIDAPRVVIGAIGVERRGLQGLILEVPLVSIGRTGDRG